MSKVESYNVDLSNNCRLCMKSGKNVRSIFSDSHEKLTDISALIYDCTNIKVTVNDCTTRICQLCDKQIASIANFRLRCASANELLKKQSELKQNVETTFERNDDDSEKECIPLLDLNEGDNIPSNSLWAKYDFDEISDFEMPSPSQLDEQIVNSTTEDTQLKQSVVTDGSTELGVSICRTVVKPRCKMKDSSKQSRKSLHDWPKLKKRDLTETKAYRGLCHLCGKEYQHLWVHLQSHSNVPTETCDICGKGFRSKANLSLHILLHKEAEMPCEVCGKKYRTKMRLKRHMRVHTQNRPFFCSVCQKRFYTKYNLEVHGRIHSGERPFLCSAKTCNERFAHSYALKHHMEKVHRLDSEINKLCN